MASLGDLMVRVGADLSGFQTEMGKINTTLGTAAKDAEKSFSGFGAIGTQLTTIGAGLTTAITLPLAGAGAAATKFYADFEGEMNRVSALGGITGGNLDALKKQALDLGAQTKFSAGEAAGGMAELSAAGFTATQTMQAMPAVLNLAAAGQLSIKDASEVAASVMAGFGIEAGKVGGAVDVMAKAAASGALSVGDIGKTFQYVGPIASAAGLNFNEIAAATTLLSNAGIKGEQAGTGLRGVIEKLVDPSDKAAAALNRLGVDATDSSGKLNPLNQIFEQLKTSGATTADMFTIFGQNAATAATVLTQQSGPALAAMKLELDNSKGAAEQMATTLNSGLGGALERAKGSIETAGISIGQLLAPAIISIAGAIETGANKLNEFAQWFGTLPTPVQQAAGAIGLVAAAIGPVVLAAGTMLSAFASIGTALGSLGILSTTAGTALGGTAAAAGTAATAVGGLSAAAAAIVPVVVAVVAAFAAWSVVELVKELGGLGGDLKDLATQFLPDVSKATDAVVGVFKDLLSGAKDLLRPIADVAKNVADFVLELGPVKALVDGVKTAWGYLTDKIKNISWWSILSGALTPALTLVRTMRDEIHKLTGKYPEMDAAAKTASGNLQTYNNNMARSAADAAMAIGGKQKAHVDIKPHIDAHATASGELTTKHREEKTAVEDLVPKNELLFAIYEKLKSEESGRIRTIADLTIELGRFKGVTTDLVAEGDKLALTLGGIGTQTGNANTAFANLGLQTPPALDKVIAGVGGIDTAVGDLTKTVEADAPKHKTAIETAWDGIKTKVTGTSGTIPTIVDEWGKGQTSIVGAAKQAGLDIEGAMGTTLGNVKDKISTKTGEMSTLWGDWTSAVKGKIDTLGTDITSILFEGDTSWGEKGKKILGELKDTFFATFTTEATNIVKNFINGALTDLLSGQGLGGVFNSLKSIGSELKEIFTGLGNLIGGGGGGGGAAGAAGGVAGAAGGAAGAAGGAAIAGAVGGIVGAISGVISNFQNARQETTLNAIEANTRFAWISIGGGAGQDIVSHTGATVQKLVDVVDRLDWQRTLLQEGVIANLEKAEQALTMNLGFKLGNIETGIGTMALAVQSAYSEILNLSFDMGSLVSIGQRQYEALIEIGYTLRSGMNQPVNVTVNYTGTGSAASDARAIGNLIGGNLNLRGAHFG
jgi:TP901 family phage tail tape measure protein